MPVTLAEKNLTMLPPKVAAPRYDRAGLRSGIVHFGVGNFHRAHMAVYLDDLLNEGLDKDWGIVGAGVQPADQEMRRRLAQQDWLTTVVEADNRGMDARVVGSMIDFLPIGDQTAILDRLEAPSTRIVSLTITEGGYFIDPASGRFNPDHPAMMEDAAHPGSPKTIFGLMVAALRSRRKNGDKPFTVMSCDNIPQNGKVTKSVLIGLAHMSDPDLAIWIADCVSCPNGMVDRITPATSEKELDRVKISLSLLDAAPVFCERFKQWVIEDDFCAGRPMLERVGVTFVRDVEPFERMKMRILNGGHAAVGYAAALLDLNFIHTAMAAPLIASFLRKVGSEEIIPLVPDVPGIDLHQYLAVVAERFANVHINDTVRRVCFDGSNRQPKYVLPIVRDGLARGTAVEGLAFISALWARYCYGETDSGMAIEANDPLWARLQTHARAARLDPASFLAMEDIFGEIGRDKRYIEAFTKALSSLWQSGARKTIQLYLDNN